MSEEFKCIVCGMKKPKDYCCENNIAICLDCCSDECQDSTDEDKKR